MEIIRSRSQVEVHRHLGLAYGRREPAFNAINNVALIL